MNRLMVTLLVIALSTLACGVFAAANGEASARPEWMWADTTRHDPQQVELRTSFRIDGAVLRADLRLATEFTNCEFELGNKTVLTLDDYGPWLDLDVTDQVGTGDGSILLRCAGSTGPSAVLFELTVTTIDSQRHVIRSGSGWQARVALDDSLPWQGVSVFGTVAAEYWEADRTARITPFENYEQWRQASDQDSSADPAQFLLRPGFEMDRIREADQDDGSWVSMAFDAAGRLTIGREDKGLLRMTLAGDGKSVAHVETIDDTLLECRGLAYTGDSLYAQANNSKGLYRLDDVDGDGRFETSQLLREFPGGVGHGRNDLALGPDRALYAIFGDSVDLPTRDVIDHTSPFREARRGERTTEGHLMRFDPDGSRWHLLCGGLRNPFGIDFNIDGEAFTYDADAEFDMGSPWYRPTRLVHLVAGGDYGWRGRTNTWPPYDADHADFTLPAGDIGKGSPTAVKSGANSGFPEQYRMAMFALDWAYGRVLACHLVPRGAGYVCRAESFLQGRPLNVTDLEFGPNGSLFLITGGRKTRSSLYRVRWTGSDVTPEEPTLQQVARQEFSRSQREARRRIADSIRNDVKEQPVSDIWEWIGHPDPMLRDAARVALERQPIDQWEEIAFDESRPSWIVPAMLALARSDRSKYAPRILERLLELPIEAMSGYERSLLLETWSRCLATATSTQSDAHLATADRIASWFPDQGPPVIAPTGAGRTINHQLGLLAMRLDIPELIPRTLSLLSRSRTQQDRMHALFVLRNRTEGWTGESRRIVFEALGDLDRTALGGEGMPGFLKQLRDDLVATMSEPERIALGELIMPGNELDLPTLTIQRPLVKAWQSGDIDALLAASPGQPNLQRGRELFDVALCSRCHRSGEAGGVTGPDLTSVASRFGRHDILLSILEPSRVIDEKYRSEQVVTGDGRVIVGRLATGGDYRSTKLRLAPDPLKPLEMIEIDKRDIESHTLSSQSPMPAGLLDTLTIAEIADLLAYLEHGSSQAAR